LRNASLKLKTRQGSRVRLLRARYQFNLCGPVIPDDADRYRITADGNCDWDIQRPPINQIDTIVVHHTESDSSLSWQRLSEIQKQRLYSPNLRQHSGHFRKLDDGQQEEVFYAYHYIVRSDGSFERLLNDHEIGWHSHNWDVNVHSIAIVLDGDYKNKQPGAKMLDAIKQIVAMYPNVRFVISHHEVYKRKICPGPWFEKFKDSLQPVRPEQ